LTDYEVFGINTNVGWERRSDRVFKGICTPPGGEPEQVTIIQFVGTPTRAVFLRSDGTLSEAEISWLSNVHEELVPGAFEMPSLTQRQQDVLRYLAKGYSNSLIAEELGISKQTAKIHVSDILSKLRVSNRTQAVSMAIEHNLL
jgi:DNA-binding CsgD family transcriptional regulator